VRTAVKLIQVVIRITRLRPTLPCCHIKQEESLSRWHGGTEEEFEVATDVKSVGICG